MEYSVRANGTADLPIIGNVMVADQTISQCEKMLAAAYAEKNGYKDPFVQVQITNRRVIVFPGTGGDAKVVTLQNNNTTLMEVIALAGGVADRGRADRIKLIREVENKRVMYTLDLSTVDGLKYADLVVQAGDYIYVEPNEELAKKSIERISPVVSIISSSILIITFITTLTK
jgi:polysaccharide biosynthesis/export protein